MFDTKLKKDLDEEFYKIMELKKTRVHFDIGDYVEKKEKEIYTKDGDSYTVEVEEFKDLKDLISPRTE